MSTRIRTFLLAVFGFALFWFAGPLFVRNYEAFMEKRGWDQLGNRLWDYLEQQVPELAMVVSYLPSGFWAGAFLTLAVWGMVEVLHALRRKPPDTKAEQLLLKEHRVHKEAGAKAKRREAARSLDDLHAEGVAQRNSLRQPVPNFDYEAQKRVLSEWNARVMLIIDVNDVSTGDRSRFRTLDRWTPEYVVTAGKSDDQKHIESMWNEKLKRLRVVIDRLDT